MDSRKQLSLVLVNLLNGTKRVVPPFLLRFLLRIESWTFHLFRCITRVYKDDYCPLVLPWFAINDRSTAMNRIHCLAMSWDSNLSKTRIIVLTFFWPLFSTVHALRAMRIYATYVTRQYKVSRGRQLIDQIILMNLYNITPTSYYKFKLFEDKDWRKVLNYLQHHEICALLPGLYKDLNTQELDDKLLFFENVTRQGLPTPAVIAVFKRGVMQRYKGNWEQLPRVDLVVKPSNLDCGTGVQRWRYEPDTDQWSNNHQTLNEEEFILKLCTMSQDNQYILQHYAPNHREIQPFAGKGVCTVRVVTYRRWQGTPQLLLACLRMPTANSFVDNFAAGGIASPISPSNGRLGPAIAKDIRVGSLHFHPDNGTPITGHRLPYWKETIELSIAAHNCFPQFAFIGWDIIITETGPVLLEANSTWCVDLSQMPLSTPIGETVFPEVFLEHLMLRHDLKIETI